MDRLPASVAGHLPTHVQPLMRPTPPSDRISARLRRRLLPRRNLAGSVYGTILVSSVIVGLSQTDLTAGQIMATVAVTGLVFGLAHAWSNALARSASDRQALAVDHVMDGIRHEWPMVSAVLPAGRPCAGSARRLLGEDRVVGRTDHQHRAAVLLGAILRHRAGATTFERFMAGSTTAALGLMLVALKVLVH